ncbi:CAP domain-containing protein [Mycobacterium sp. 48b]|uniref:CAP domain-containing protein n=1 Tax=Mycobacterium sp. 48b TaxID=3400426 RepID=UPI003AB017C6
MVVSTVLTTAPRLAVALLVMPALATTMAAPTAHADNQRLNNSVLANVYTIQHQAGCPTNVKMNPKLRLAAEWHTNDVLNNRALDGDIGSDGTMVSDRARNAGYTGDVSETVAINPALAINGMDILNQWYWRPDYMGIMQDCGNIEMGVWSANSLDRSVVVAVYGKGERAA